MKVEWDEVKSVTNRRKHGISFEEAAELFARGQDFLEIFDEAHSEFEERFIAIGPIRRGLVLVVWTAREDGDILRIISARWAAEREQFLYHSFLDKNR
ncbi:MAG: BrnT family toxin [bacterium]